MKNRLKCLSSGRPVFQRFFAEEPRAVCSAAIFLLLVICGWLTVSGAVPAQAAPAIADETADASEWHDISQSDIQSAMKALKNIGEGLNRGQADKAMLSELCSGMTALGQQAVESALSGNSTLKKLGPFNVPQLCASLSQEASVKAGAFAEGMARQAFISGAGAALRATKLPYVSHIELEGGVIGGDGNFSALTVQPLWADWESGDFIFNQLSWQHETGTTDDGDADNTLNAGLAYRTLLKNDTLLLGANVFFDHQLDQNHNRMSIGVDAQTSLYGFTANQYIPLTQWKKIDSLYEARALSGQDMEFSGQMESMPSWTVFVKGYRWDATDDASDIYGYDTTVEWSPVPALVTVAGIRDESGSGPDARAALRLRFNLNQPFKEQFTTRTALSSVADRVWNKVRRENTIRTQTRKQPGTQLRVLETTGANTVTTDQGTYSLSTGLLFNMPATVQVAGTLGAVARLQLADGGKLTLGQGTTLKIEPGLITLVTGDVQYVSGSTDVTVNVPGGTITLLGTDIDIVSNGTDSTVRVRNGSVRVNGSTSGSVSLSELAMASTSGGIAAAVATGSAAYLSHTDDIAQKIDWTASEQAGNKLAPYLASAPYLAQTATVPGQAVLIGLHFSQPVTATGGTPQLSLQVGGNTRVAPLISGGGTADLIFSYVIQPGDAGISAITVKDIDLNGATLGNGGKPAALGLPDTTLDLTGSVSDVVAPSGYAVAFTTDPINAGNATAAAFQISQAEVGATYNYTITSSGGAGSVSGSGSISAATQSVSGINVSGLPDGTLTVSLTLTDAASNTGIAATDTVGKTTALTIVHTANIIETSAISPAVFTATNIGAANATRIVVVSIFTRGNDINLVSIGGAAATKAYGASGVGGTAYYANVYYRAVPSGTTADISVTAVSGSGFPYVGSVYSITGSPTTSVDGFANGTTANASGYMNTTFDIHAGGVAVWVGTIGNNGFTGSFNNATTDFVGSPLAGRTTFTSHLATSTDLIGHNEINQDDVGGSSHVLIGVSFKP